MGVALSLGRTGCWVGASTSSGWYVGPQVPGRTSIGTLPSLCTGSTASGAQLATRSGVHAIPYSLAPSRLGVPRSRRLLRLLYISSGTYGTGSTVTSSNQGIACVT